MLENLIWVEKEIDFRKKTAELKKLEKTTTRSFMICTFVSYCLGTEIEKNNL